MAWLQLLSSIGRIRIVEEPQYSFGSADNERKYAREITIGDGDYIGSPYGVLVDDVPAVVLAGGGLMMPIEGRSALVWKERLFIGVGNCVACLSLRPLVLIRSVQVDFAACFSLHVSPVHDALICHGEVEISRLSAEGDLLWQSSGRDIFTGLFALKPTHIEAHDFNEDVYRLRYEDGSAL